MGRLAFLIIPALLIGLVAFGKLGNPDGGFSYTPPPGYREEAPPPGMKAMLRRDTANGAIGCSVTVQANPAFYVTWNSFLDDAGGQVMSKITRELESRMPGTKVLRHGIERAGDIPVLVYEYSILEGGRRAGTGMAFYFIAGITQYNISCGAPLADEALMKSDMAAMLRGFRFAK